MLKSNKPEILFHLASQPGVMYSYINPDSYKQNNIISTKNLISIAKKIDLRKIIFTSSSSVYGDHKKYPIKENFKLKPKNYYAKTKLKCEEILKKDYYLKNKNQLCIFRPFTVLVNLVGQTC